MPFGKGEWKGTGLRHAYLFILGYGTPKPCREKTRFSTDAREEKDIICAKFQLLLCISGERNASCYYDSDF